MKRILTTLALISSMVMPSAKADSFTPYSYQALSCMRNFECTEKVNKVNKDNWEGETWVLLSILEDLDIEVYIADGMYFPEAYGAVYYADTNIIFINVDFMKDSDSFRRYVRHEGWHVVQDCFAGMGNSELLPLYGPGQVPPEVTEETIERYGANDPFVVKIEREAVWAAKVPDMTVDALLVCKGEE